jgi:hypothetical protein
MNDPDVLFISCGQQTGDEKNLGAAIIELVTELTSFRPYFAEEVSSLDGLTNSILSALESASAFVTVMHPRGRVTSPSGHSHIRGSVWIEQEIAIAAHLVHVHKKKLRVQAYVHHDIFLEGIRQQLHLNPVRFSTDSEILDDLRTKLPTWSPRPEVRLLGMRFNPVLTSFRDGVVQCQLELRLWNKGTTTIKEYHVDIQVPVKLLEGNTMHYWHEISAKRTATHRFFRFPALDGRVAPVYPNDEVRVLEIPFYVDRSRQFDVELQNMDFIATAYVEGKPFRDAMKVADAYRAVDVELFLPTKLSNN